MTAEKVQASDWNGRNGDQWVAHQASLDQMLAPFGAAAIAAAAPQPGDHILDIGCGAGDSSLHIAGLVGQAGTVMGLDISAALIERAGERARNSGSSALFQLADAARAPLPVATYDCLFSRFGVMFFDDPVAAFGHMRSALKPDGRLVFVCWRTAAENDWVSLPMGAIKGIVPSTPPPPADAPGPFSFGDGDRVRTILSAAGFADIALTPFDHAIPFASDVAAAVRRACDVGPLERALLHQSDAVRAQAMQAVGDAFAGRRTEEGVIINGAAWIVTATAA
ncbi:class I SAM-dependent methyltransferase [Sphingobium sp. YR768]|uniref:class I SAM-dependent methyltransferase n=1 Tax=Sphingobium sp. YR768 TaxID=1884365 RepID=UPI0008B95670|nr:class I SAM-dependent methyltransferase [Sphingobium sp. YR768]SER19332.1 Ubiquinone/menaquinone biosynthesis C-methylase UbiE [Sphingobium sp. YR768]